MSNSKALLNGQLVSTRLESFWFIILCSRALVIIAASKLQTRNETASANHFSVEWMGFAPTDYSSEYPEYYICKNNLKYDPLRMQIALQIKNQESNAFYLKVDQYGSPPSGWSILPMAVGQINVDETRQFVFNNVFRSKPTSILQGATDRINQSSGTGIL